MILPRRPGGPVPPDEDPTGVRALLSSLPEPGPMPQDLVARISASLAAEQATHTPAHPRTVAPLVRRRGRRVALAAVGAAAAVAAVAALGTAGFDLLQRGGSTTSAGAAAQLATGAGSGSAGSQAGPARTPALAPRIRLQLTSTQYTDAGFAAQARALPPPSRPSTPLAAPSGAGAVATTRGLLECLKALGESDADAVSADIAYYDGQPAAVILTWHGTATTAYAVRRDCSRNGVAVLHPATSLQ